MQLFEGRIVDLTLYYTRTKSERVAINKALHDINATLKKHCLSCEAIDLSLPMPIGRSTEALEFLILDLEVFDLEVFDPRGSTSRRETHDHETARRISQDNHIYG